MLKIENPIIFTCFEDESYKKWRSRFVYMARISSVIRYLSHRKHYYNLLHINQSQNPIKILKNDTANIGCVETFQQNKK
jgi:hypothetical protein